MVWGMVWYELSESKVKRRKCVLQSGWWVMWGGHGGLQEPFWLRHLEIIFYSLYFISRIFCIDNTFPRLCCLNKWKEGAPEISVAEKNKSLLFSHSTFWLHLCSNINFGSHSATHAERVALIWDMPCSWWKEKRNNGAVMAYKVLAAHWHRSLAFTFLWPLLPQRRSLQVTCQQAGYKNYNQSYLPLQMRLSFDKGTIL